MRPCHERIPARLRRSASPLVLATMLAMQPQPVLAQAFQGTPTVILGSVNRATGVNSETLTVTAPQNTINWTPNDSGPGPAPINFLPAGSTASFASGTGAPYTVLNRIIAADPTRAIQFAGTVNSDSLGSIWFYAPGGLLLSSTAQFNVGSLLLTANDPVGAAAGQPYLDATGGFRLAAAANSTAGIDMQPGAQINAINPGSYVIAVAPKFTVAGTINVNGSAALAAVEDVSFTLNGGLFDITANIGSSAGGTSGVIGTITGPGSPQQGIYHRIYLMAVPRNVAMTLLISGGANIGFDVATAADVDGNAVVLSGGYDIVASPAGEGLAQFSQRPVAGSVGNVQVTLDNANFTSTVTARSKNGAEAATNSGSLSFASNLAIVADGVARVDARNGLQINVAGNVLADASTYGDLQAGASRTAGTAQINAASGGILTAGVSITAQAIGKGDTGTSPGMNGGTGTGGNASINALGGSIRAGLLIATADGFGGISLAGRGGTGAGGTAVVQKDAAGVFTGIQQIAASANALGALGFAGQQSGDANGGTANVLVGGTFAVAGTLSATADAGYQQGQLAPHLAGGTAKAGTANVNVQAGATLTASQILVSAAAQLPFGAGGNAAIGGQATLFVSDSAANTSVTVPGGVTVSAAAVGADGDVSGNPDGGAATGGFAQISAAGHPLLDLGGDQTMVTAAATGGNGAGGIGGAALGGRTMVNLQNGGSLLIANQLFVDASATGGSGTKGGAATAFDNGDGQAPGVLVAIGAGANASDIGIRAGGSIIINANASGGTSSAGAGGDARGGFAVMRANSSAISSGFITIDGSAQGGDGLSGGIARSGRLFGRINDANLFTSGDLTFVANAVGGNAFGGAGGRGGDGIVGRVSLTQSSLENGPGSIINVKRAVIIGQARGGNGDISANGSGGDGGDAYGVDPNAAQGGLVIGVQPARSTFTAGLTVVDNSSIGGNGGVGTGTANGGRGGNGFGGFVNLGVISGPVTPVTNQSSIDFGSLAYIEGRVRGGEGGGIDGSGLGGRGGDATGGTHIILTRGGIVRAADVQILSFAEGGSGGAAAADLGGGNAIGGKAGILATPHFTAGLPADLTVTGNVTLQAYGVGGASLSAPGSGTGGEASILLQKHEAAGAAPAATSGSLTIAGSFTADASGAGGAALLTGTNSGAGTGGLALLRGQQGKLVINGDVSLYGDGVGGAVTGPGGSAGKGGGGIAELNFDGGSTTLNGANLVMSAAGRFGSATGGTAHIVGGINGGSLDVNAANVSLVASALAGDLYGQPGTGPVAGGIVEIISGPGGALRLRNPGTQGSLTIEADAIIANQGDSSASASGGRITITGNGDLTTNAPALTLSAQATAGNGGKTLPGGNATGGTVQIIAQGGAVALNADTGPISLIVDALAGNSDSVPGSAFGGQVSALAVGSTLRFGTDTLVRVGATAGGGPIPGAATGGSAGFNLALGGRIDLAGSLTIVHAVAGHDAQGGDTSISSSGGSFATTGDLVLSSDVRLSDLADGGTARGGDVVIAMADGDGFSVGGNLAANVSASAVGPAGGRSLAGGTINWDNRGTGAVTGQTSLAANVQYVDGAVAGAAQAGTISVMARSGKLTLADTSLDATAGGGTLPTGVAAPAAGGTLTLGSDAGAGIILNGLLSMTANGLGTSNSNGTGGLGQGGSISLSNAGSMTINAAGQPIQLSANGTGGFSVDSLGGIGQGGSISITTASAGQFALVDPAQAPLVLFAGGHGGQSNGAGGAGLGGSIAFTVAGTAALAGDLVARAEGAGGDGSSGPGGAGSGGSVVLSSQGGSASVAGGLSLVASGLAGNGSGPAAAGTGGGIDVSSTAGNGGPGSFGVIGAAFAEASGTGANADGTPSTAGAVRLFATGGSQLSLGSLTSLANGAVAGTGLRGGLLADQGSTLAIAGDALVQSGVDLGLNDGGTIAAGGTLSMAAGGRVLSAFAAPTPGATGVVTAALVDISGVAGISIATNTTGSTDVRLASAAGGVQVQAIAATRDISINAATGLGFTSQRADRNLTAASASSITGGSASAGGRLTLDAGTTLAAGPVDAGVVNPAAGVTPDAFLRSGGALTVGAVASGGDLGIVAGGTLTSAALASGRDLVLLAGGNVATNGLATPTTGRIRIGAASQQGLIGFVQGVPDYSALFAAAPVAVPGNVSVTGNVTTGLFEASASGLLQITGLINAALGAQLNANSLQLGNASSQGFLDLVSVDNVILGNLSATGALSITSNGSITTGSISTGQSLVLSASQPGTALSTGSIRADGEIRLSSATTLTTGGLSAGNRVFLTAGGAISTGAIDAGTVNPAAGASGVLFATSQASIATGAVNVSGSATLSGVQGVTSGNIAAPGGIVLLDAGNIAAGSLTTSPTGFVYIAAHDLLPQISFDAAGNPQVAALLASTPVRLIGNIGIGGATSTGRFIAAATGNLTAPAITSPSGALIDVGGLATLNGNVSAASISLTASDVAIAPGVSIGGGSTTSISLRVDAGATAAVIGGPGVATAGTFSLSNAEFGTLRADSISVQMSSGPLTLDQLALAAVSPATGLATNQLSFTSAGLLRVTGAVTMAEAGAQNRVSLAAGSRIEVVQGSGSVRLGAGVDSPAGTLSLAAPRIWVASDSLLAQLAGGQLTGQARDNALNAAGAPAVAGGSIGAGTILASIGNELLIQNSGSVLLKAGFTTGTGGLQISRAGQGNGLLDVVINGRIQRADSSFAINRDTVDLVKFAPGTAVLTANSAVNGCIIGGICPGVLPDAIAQPVVTIVNNIDALTIEEQVRREAARAAAERLPIVVLQRLIDFGPLFSDPDATDPVTSGGNPALWQDPGPRSGLGGQK